MNKIFRILSFAALFAGLASCWTEEIPSAGEARPQVKDLKAVAGDEEVQLSWTLPEGYTASNFIITYATPSQETETINAETSEYTVAGLQNEYEYTFSVQAVYGDLISNAVSAKGKPTTSRFPVLDLSATSGDSRVTLNWSKPHASVLSYTLSYYMADTPDNVVEQAVDKDATSVEVTGLTNDKTYVFTLAANYAKGPAVSSPVRSMPSQLVISTDPYLVDRTSVAADQPVTFTFNREVYPTVTDIRWVFPGGAELAGDEVKYAFKEAGIQSVLMYGNFNGVVREFEIRIEVRAFVVEFNQWEITHADGYNGIKGAVPVFSPDGKTVYALTFRGNASLYAFDIATGALKWKYIPEESSTEGYGIPTVNPKTGDIYYGTTVAGQFFAVTSEGALKWKFAPTGSLKAGAPAVKADGTTVYICDDKGNVYALDALSGAQKWAKTDLAQKGQGGGLLVNGDELIVGMKKKVLYFLDIADGSVKHEVAMSNNMTEISGMAVSNDKTVIYIPHSGGKMSSVDIVNHKIIVDGFQVATGDIYEPIVAPNGTIFVGSKDCSCYNVSADLTAVNWSYASAATSNGFNYSHPCVDTENRFYITHGGQYNHTYVLDASGALIEEYQYGSNTHLKQMGGNNFLDGVLYMGFVGDKSGVNGAFVGKYFGGTRAESWGAHGGDICGSCCIK